MGEVPLSPAHGSPRVFRLVLEYDGSQFMGWQVQPGLRTVQGELERVLARVVDEPVRVHGAGRTDRGVHAFGQVASFRTAAARSPGEIHGGLAAWLPHDIVVREVSEAGAGFHARHSAVGRRYLYRVSLERTALERERTWVVRPPLKVGRMRRAARDLVGEHDFSPFAVALGEEEYTRLTVREATLRRRGPEIELEIEANRFLRRMVRSIVGVLVEVGRGRLDASVIFRVLHAGEPMPACSVAPAQGLYLLSVAYKTPPGR